MSTSLSERYIPPPQHCRLAYGAESMNQAKRDDRWWWEGGRDGHRDEKQENERLIPLKLGVIPHVVEGTRSPFPLQAVSGHMLQH